MIDLERYHNFQFVTLRHRNITTSIFSQGHYSMKTQRKVIGISQMLAKRVTASKIITLLFIMPVIDAWRISQIPEPPGNDDVIIPFEEVKTTFLSKESTSSKEVPFYPVEE